MALGSEEPLILQRGPCNFSSNENFTAPLSERRCRFHCITGICMVLWYSRGHKPESVGFYILLNSLVAFPLPMDKLFDFLCP